MITRVFLTRRGVCYRVLDFCDKIKVPNIGYILSIYWTVTPCLECRVTLRKMFDLLGVIDYRTGVVTSDNIMRFPFFFINQSNYTTRETGECWIFNCDRHSRLYNP